MALDFEEWPFSTPRSSTNTATPRSWLFGTPRADSDGAPTSRLLRSLSAFSGRSKAHGEFAATFASRLDAAMRDPASAPTVSKTNRRVKRMMDYAPAKQPQPAETVSARRQARLFPRVCREMAAEGTNATVRRELRRLALEHCGPACAAYASCLLYTSPSPRDS